MKEREKKRLIAYLMLSSTNRRRKLVYTDTATLRDIDANTNNIKSIKRLLIYVIVTQMLLVAVLASLVFYITADVRANHDAEVYLVAILRQAEMHGTVARKMHNRPFPLTEPEIKFVADDITTGLVPSPYPGTLQQLRQATVDWMNTYHMPCAAPGGFTAPISLAVFPNSDVMLNIRLFVNESLSAHPQRSAIEEKSPTQQTKRVVSRYEEIYLSHVNITGAVQDDIRYAGEMAYCLQMFFHVWDDNDNAPFTHESLQEL